MPLRLRRGTNTERQLITPQEGELIYVTDTKELWAGDGTTQGGIKVTGIVPERLNDLGDVDLSVAPQLGQVLKWNGAAFVAADDIDTDTDTVNAGIVEGSNYRINIVRDDSTIMVDTLTGTFAGNFVGDASGLTNFPPDIGIAPGGNYNINLVSEDGTVMVDTFTKIFTGDASGLTNFPPDIGIAPGGNYNINIISDDSTIMIDSLNKIFTGDASGLTNFPPDIGIVPGGNYNINIISDDSTIMIDTLTNSITGNFIGDASGLINFPADVGVVSGGNYSINILGDDSSIIINSADNSLTTNDIYHSENALIIKNSNSLLRSVVEVESDDELARLVIARASAEIIDDTMVYGRLDFKKDDPDGPLVTAAIGADNLGLFFTYSSSGIGETESNYVTFSANSNFGIGTWTPTERLDVRGNGIFTGTVTASSFKGSIVTDDSTTFVDAINGTISASGYIQFGSYTTIERDLLNAVNGMVIYNSTTDRFQGYQNNAWINLDDGSLA